jgi:hypothetical protein
MKTRIISKILSVKQSVSSIAAVYSLDAVWYQMLTGASCDRLRNFAYSTASSGFGVPQATQMAARRKSDGRRDDLCAV